jgi:hypothetical protein
MKLSLSERIRLAWELVWPLFLFDLGAALFIYAVLGRERQDLESVYVVVSILVVAPWVVRRALRRQFPSFQIVCIKDATESYLTWQDSLRVFWLLAWRSMAAGLALLIPLSLLLNTLDWKPRLANSSRLLDVAGLSVLDLISGLVLFPALIPGMLRKKYATFELETRRRGSVTRMKTNSLGNVRKQLVRRRRHHT